MGLTSEQSDSDNEREVVEHPNGEYFTMQHRLAIFGTMYIEGPGNNLGIHKDGEQGSQESRLWIVFVGNLV